MVLHIAFTPDTEARLRARAAAAGKNLESFVLEAVDEKLRVPERIAELLAPLHAATWASGTTELDVDAFIEDCRDEARRGAGIGDRFG